MRLFAECVKHLYEVELARSARKRQEFPSGKGVSHVTVVRVDKHLPDFLSEFEASFSAHWLRGQGRRRCGWKQGMRDR